MSGQGQRVIVPAIGKLAGKPALQTSDHLIYLLEGGTRKRFAGKVKGKLAKRALARHERGLRQRERILRHAAAANAWYFEHLLQLPEGGS